MQSILYQGWRIGDFSIILKNTKSVISHQETNVDTQRYQPKQPFATAHTTITYVQNSMGAKRNNCGPLKELTKNIHWQQLLRADLLQRAVRDFFLHLLFFILGLLIKNGLQTATMVIPCICVRVCVCVFNIFVGGYHVMCSFLLMFFPI